MRSLEKSLGLNVVDFNITTLTRREDLLPNNDQISTPQLANRHHKYLVFIDEINANLENETVYDAFLTPLEDGYYIRSGNKFFIYPCYWLFVGTTTAKKIKKSQKGSDFMSRMTYQPLDLSRLPTNERHCRQIENVHIGAAIAKNRFSGLRSLHKDIVFLLANLSDKASVRDIRRLVHGNDMWVDSKGHAQWTDFQAVLKSHSKLLDLSMEDTTKHYLKSYDKEFIPIEDGEPYGSR